MKTRIQRAGRKLNNAPWCRLSAKIVGMLGDQVIVVSTTASEGAARALAAGAIEARLGGCAQVVGPITSVYRWNDEVRTEQEWRLEIKTTADGVTALTAHIKDNHSYDLPEIIAIPIAGGSAEYLSWLMAETRR